MASNSLISKLSRTIYWKKGLIKTGNHLLTRVFIHRSAKSSNSEGKRRKKTTKWKTVKMMEVLTTMKMLKVSIHRSPMLLALKIWEQAPLALKLLTITKLIKCVTNLNTK